MEAASENQNNGWRTPEGIFGFGKNSNWKNLR